MGVRQANICSLLDSHLASFFSLSKWCGSLLLQRGSCGVGPSGFQTKGLESPGVIAVLFFSRPALCCVLCSTLTVDGYSPRCLSRSMALFGISLLNQLLSYLAGLF